MIQIIILLGFLIFLLAFAASILVQIFFTVPFVPSQKKVVSRMISLASLKPKETVYDLGCGDGRLLFEAEKKARVKAVGFEIAPLPYFWALLKKLFLGSNAAVRFQNFFKANLRKTDVIFCYLFPVTMKKLSGKIKRECRKGTRIISNTFHLPGFEPVKVLKKNKRAGLPTIYLYKI